MLEKAFRISSQDMKNIISSFHADMSAGLSGKRSSLKMIPAYVDRPTEIEAYQTTVAEAKRIGMTDEQIIEYLKTE